jgi:hypothetical protein
MAMVSQPLSGSPILIRVMALAFLIQQAAADRGEALTAKFWVLLMAPACFAAAMWAASGVMMRVKQGEAFAPAMLRGLLGMGFGLILGALSAILFQLSLIWLMGNGFSELRGVKLDWGVENLAIGLAGLVLVFVAEHGRRLRADLDSFV